MMEIILIFIFIMLGFLTGAVTGLVPGIHVNTIAALMVGVSAFLLNSFEISPIAIAVYIASTAITHSFFDYVPSLFLGVPNDEVFALLPGQKMVREGRGLEALQLSVLGSWNGLLYSLFTIAVILSISYLTLAPTQGSGSANNLVALLESAIRPYLFWILLVTSLVLIITERKKVWALTIFILSGLFGLVVFASPLVPGGSSAAFSALFPALTGLFGVSGLLLSLTEKNSELPFQEDKYSIGLKKSEVYMATARGTAAGMAVGLLPGLGGANAATLLFIIEEKLSKRREVNNGENYIVTTSAINTSDTLFGIAALYLIAKSRSGASVAIDQLLEEEITFWVFLPIVGALVLAGFFAKETLSNKKCGRLCTKIISSLKYKPLSVSMIAFMSLLVFFTTGFWGLLILICATALGMISPIINVRRAQAMGFFLVPVMLYFSGQQRWVTTALALDSKSSLPVYVEVKQIAIYFLISLAMGVFTYVVTSGFLTGKDRI